MQKRNLLLAIISGFLLALAMPRPGIWPLAWAGLAPLLIAVHKSNTRQAAIYGFAAGLVYFGTILYWISIFGYLPWALVTIIESVFFAVFSAMAARFAPSRKGPLGYILVPAAWTAVQWLRSLGAYAFTWGSFAHTQAASHTVIQLASLAGPWLIDFLVCLVNVSLAEFIVSKSKRRAGAAAIALICILTVWTVGSAIIRTEPRMRPSTKVAIIQGNVDQDVVPNIDYLANTYVTYSTMSAKAVDEGAQIIVWPETTLPTPITDYTWGGILSGLAKKSNATYIIGAYAPSSDPHNPLYYNSALCYGPGGENLGTYHKVRLVPFGEFVPLRDYLPFLSSYGIRDQDVLPGESHNLIQTNIGKIGISICFESLFADISRNETKNGARALFVITNDAWFEHTSAAQGHLMMSQLRAVENRRYIVRGAATGISAIIDPYGRMQADLGIFKQGMVSGKIQPLDMLTPYTRSGDWPAYLCALISLVMVTTEFRRKRSKQSS
ncbi:apolipoprotein N-acyltransferase [bacterium]|nr:apolipoprotein N-acyltransferase [bacterium]